MTLMSVHIFTNKVLLEHSHAHCLHIVYGYFHATAAELSSCNRDTWPVTLKYLLSSPLIKCWLALALGSYF